jgi:DNA-binding winged helix-turn-helix (wHTH) protein
MRYVFGEFALDDGTRQLLRAGRELPLGAKAFELLELLIRARPKVLSRTRLRQALWPATHVGPTSLHVLVSQLRGLLGDDPDDPHWIRTVHGFGYAFRGDASEEADPANDAAGPPGKARSGSWLVQGEQQWPLAEGTSVLGRSESAAVRIRTGGVSRRHARVVVSGGRAVIEDLGSKNGTFVGDERVAVSRRLVHGDVIRLGRSVRLEFRQDDEDATESESSG